MDGNGLSASTLDITLGALQIGVLISYLLFGVTTTQTYIYFQRFPYDSRNLKALVAFVWVCEFGHAICLAHGLYTYTITNYGNPERLALAFPKSLLVGTVLSTVIATVVQGFFASRIYILRVPMRLYICLVISVLLFFRLLSGSTVSIIGMGVTFLAPFEKQWGWMVTVTWSISAATDFMIAAILTVSLRNRSKADHGTGG
ncbi:hypothetical protein MSAN_00519300 [Mycena sanguinolenta]|uniref:Uncharacterized protein n=1 Tax=Mycena sanguinolenta TaxID=230812 RepID=A0A8H6ZCE4_9AGAR|nr:hypothetical protein MSAN_00519300 [Mycena sanguinolenta]